MNKVLTVISLVLFGASSFAQTVSIQKMRKDLDLQIAQAPTLTKSCGQLPANVAQIQNQLKQLAEQITTLNAPQHPRIQDAMNDLSNAYSILGNANADCLNGLNSTSILLEMYLIHVDTALMEFQYGVGHDLKRIRN